MDNQTVVLDNGSGSIKAGFAGLVHPQIKLPTIVGRPKNPKCLPVDGVGDVCVGEKAESYRGLLTISHPIEHGIVKNWGDLQLIWSHVFQGLKVNVKDHPLLVTESPLNPRENREKLFETAFETFGVPSFSISIQAILALYASGRTTGVVLDCGDGVSNVVPIVEGFTLVHSIKRSDVAGRDLTEYLCSLLRLTGKVLHTSAEFDIVRKIKEESCLIDPIIEHPAELANTKYSYTLPDGTTMQIGPERIRAPELLFKPSLFGYEYPGVQQLVSSAIARTDLDLRKDLTAHILLAGGTTLIPGFVERLLKELRKLQPKDTLIRIFAPPDREYAAFAGGSILASLATFTNQLVTRKTYDEMGNSILARKQL